MYGVSSDNLARYANECSNFSCCQFANLVACWDVGERDIAFLLLLQLSAILDKIGDSLTEEWEDAIIFFDDGS